MKTTARRVAGKLADAVHEMNEAQRLSLALRTSYHVYYGLAVLLTLPFGYFATRSFQRRRKLNRPILMHFLYDSTVFLIAILVH